MRTADAIWRINSMTARRLSTKKSQRKEEYPQNEGRKDSTPIKLKLQQRINPLYLSRDGNQSEVLINKTLLSYGFG